MGIALILLGMNMHGMRWLGGEPVVRPFVVEDQQGLMSFLDSVFAGLGHEFLPEAKDSDIRNVEAAYLAGGGAFFVVAAGPGIQGCIGVRRLSGQVAELKRLYVSEGFRGRGLGWRLCAAAIEASGRLGFTALRLDTTRHSAVALGMFQRLGFKEIPRYNEDEYAEIFMERRVD